MGAQLGWQAWVAGGVVAGVFAVLMATRVPPYLAMVGGMALLLVTGVVSPRAALAGFANEGVITVAVLFVVAAGLRQAGVLAWLMGRVLGRPRSVRAAQARMAVPVMAASAFLNNTPLVAMLLPVVQDWARRVGIAPSRLLLPLSYAAILGGLTTLIGTSTNLMVNGLWIAEGHASLSLFTITPVGLAAALAGMAFMLAAGRRLLPDRQVDASVFDNPREYTVEMRVSGRGAAGRTVADVGLGHLPGMVLTHVRRPGRVWSEAQGDMRLGEGDELRFAGLVNGVADLLRLPGLAPATRQVNRLDDPRAERVFAEAVVSRTSPLVGQSAREGRFRTRYGAVVLAVARGGERLTQPVADVVLQPGDAIFLETGPHFVAQHQNCSDFCLVSALDSDGPATRERAPVALAIVVGMVVAAGTGLLTMLQAAFVAAFLMLATRVCSEATARRAIDLPLILSIGAALGLGQALDQTGLAGAFAGSLLAVGGDHPWAALAAVYATTMIITEIVTNNAAAAVAFPIAMATAHRLGVDPMPFAVAVMMAASASFATPIGYQTNLMVYGAGGYRVSDFLRIGIPMNIVVGVVTVLLLPWVFPF
ncbi:MAG: anion permease [Nitrospirae bacterium]|nr:anion permease [Nitrospirota bacterium]